MTQQTIKSRYPVASALVETINACATRRSVFEMQVKELEKRAASAAPGESPEKLKSRAENMRLLMRTEEHMLTSARQKAAEYMDMAPIETLILRLLVLDGIEKAVLRASLGMSETVYKMKLDRGFAALEELIRNEHSA